MIDAVSTLSVQSGAMRGNSQNVASLAATGAGVDKSSSSLPKLGTRLYVRIDSAAERAILEVRASETGEVVNQYPSEAQIKAFQRAEKLAVARTEQSINETQTREQTRPVRDVQVSQTRDIQTPDPVQVQQPTTSSVIAPSSTPVSTVSTGESVSTDSGASVGSGQSLFA